MRTTSKASRRWRGGWAPIVFCDFDGTITRRDVTDEILSELAHPSWREVEQEWVRGQIGSRECLERQMALVETSAEELHALIDAIPIDPHFSSFYRFTQRCRIPFYVLSDGFDYVVRRVLKRSGVNGPLRNGTHLFSSALRLDGRRLVPSFPLSARPCEHGCATCKAAIIRRLGSGRRPIIFIGDGLSDRFAIEVSDVIFAKSHLLAYCREHRVACRPFETFAEVEEGLAKLLAGEAAGRPQPTSKSKGKGQRSKVKSPQSAARAFNIQLSTFD